ncbi:MAG: glycogen debranching protein GlgX [Spirochaetales bacterium]|nr:glycogen debranching protein GlgX [Spirochaetales bacterium]
MSKQYDSGHVAKLLNRNYTQGVCREGDRYRFTLYSEHASAVTLCLYENNREETFPLEQSGTLFSTTVKTSPGTAYAYRLDGPHDPGQGLFFNPSRLLLDPFGRELARPALLKGVDLPLYFGFEETTDNVNFAALSRIPEEQNYPVTPGPGIPQEAMIIYELHVRGFTRINAHLPRELRGTFAGLAHPESIAYLTGLGVTSVELLPIFYFGIEPFLLKRGLTNYWGYNPVSFFCPHPTYAAGRNATLEFVQTVNALHDAGLEVILDVVYNHTAEGEAEGPMLSFRGIDNRVYYRTLPENRYQYYNAAGCGNTLQTEHPQVRHLILESLRHWAQLGVDGFRFDLAPVLGRFEGNFREDHPLWLEMKADPLLSTRKLIAEPWDAYPDGYRLGQCPPQFLEWNDRYRDGVRRFFLADPEIALDFQARVAGSADLNLDKKSINFLAAHDGFTLRDLLSYTEKHNEANGEENQDGSNHNHSQNFGVEGATADFSIIEQRRSAARAMLGTLFFSRGIPMIQAGDECGRTQQGNNNAYCQDNEINYFDWTHRDEELEAFVRETIARRREYLDCIQQGNYTWFSPSLEAVADLACFCLVEHENICKMIFLFNGRPEKAFFQLPVMDDSPGWDCLLSSDGNPVRRPGGTDFSVPARTMQVYSLWKRS